MIGSPLALLRLLLLALSLLCALQVLRGTKYADASARALLSAGDLVLSLLLAALLGGAAAGSWLLLVVVALPTLGLFFVTWLDAALYRVFTFELGLGGVRDVVLSNLVAEVFQMRSARRFFRSQPGFTLLPLLLLLAVLAAVVPQASRLSLLLQVLALSGLAVSCQPGTLLARARRAAADRRALWLELTRPRRPRHLPGFQLRPEHAALLRPHRAPSQVSPLHGRLAGASVVLLTFESLAARHAKTAAAQLPFLSQLAQHPHTIRSDYHLSPAPLTNVAHLALYLGCASARLAMSRPPPDPGLARLARAGYRCVYLTTADTAHYGLSQILAAAGFQQIVDGPRLSRDRRGVGQPVWDSQLGQGGLAQLIAILSAHAGPYFLHVHARNAHVPYYVEDRRRFADRDLADDRTRFLTAQEETDGFFAALYDALRALSAQRGEPHQAPLLLVSSDHGQSFGEGGYHSHGSAVTVEQTVVPWLLHHPLLPTATLPFSTHFDVLPTVLDLLGLPSESGLGWPLLTAPRPAGLLLHDGQPSRPTSSCLGLLLDHEKYVLDLVRDTLLRSSWDDAQATPVTGAERRYMEALIAHIAEEQRLL